MGVCGHRTPSDACHFQDSRGGYSCHYIGREYTCQIWLRDKLRAVTARADKWRALAVESRNELSQMPVHCEYGAWEGTPDCAGCDNEECDAKKLLAKLVEALKEEK